MKNKLKTALDILRHDKKPVKRLFCKLVAWLPFDPGKALGIKINTNGYRIHLRKSSLSLAMFYDPNSRKSDHDFITSYLRDDNIYFDVGANIGTTLIPAAMIVPNGVAMGFEPHPRIFKFLEENLRLNRLTENVAVHNIALGATDGVLNISSTANDDTNHVVNSNSGIRVPVKRLDDFTTKFDEIDLLKIDVEGYEKHVIEGGKKTLQKTRCVYFECSNEHFENFGYSVKMLLSEFERAGFSLFLKNRETQILRTDSNYQLTSHHTNVIAVRDVDDFLKRTGWNVNLD